MKTSPEIDKITEALAKAQGEYPVLENNRKAHHGGYADSTAILYAVRPILAKYGIAITRATERYNGGEIVYVRLMHGGQWIESSMLATIDANDKKSYMQAIGTAISYAVRYQLKLLLGIESVNDKDDNDYGDYNDSDNHNNSGSGNSAVANKPTLINPSLKISQDEHAEIQNELKGQTELAEKVLKWRNIEKFEDLPKELYRSTMNQIREKKALQSTVVYK